MRRWWIRGHAPGLRQRAARGVEFRNSCNTRPESWLHTFSAEALRSVRCLSEAKKIAVIVPKGRKKILGRPNRENREGRKLRIIRRTSSDRTSFPTLFPCGIQNVFRTLSKRPGKELMFSRRGRFQGAWSLAISGRVVNSAISGSWWKRASRHGDDFGEGTECVRGKILRH